MSTLDIYLFGVPRFERSGKRIDIARRKIIALLAYLAASAQPHSRDKLATLFWPENDASNARANLRRELSRLKSSLGSRYLNIDREHVGLNVEAEYHLDIKIFQEKIARVQEHGCDPREICNHCWDILSEAVALYTGDFMAGFSLPDSLEFDDWQFFLGETLKKQAAQALEKLAGYHAAAGQFDQAIELARRWLALDPLHEAAHRALMLLYVQADQRPAALRQYEICQQSLEKELGIKPDPQTSALYEQIKSGEWTGLQSGQPPESTPLMQDNPEIVTPVVVSQELPSLPMSNLPASLTLFIGRRPDLDEIGRLLADPGMRLLTLFGPGGSGKTRLAIQAGREQQSLFKDGVFFVPLAPLGSAEFILPAIAKALRYPVREKDANLLQQLSIYLLQRQVLLIMDNFEHLIAPESIAELVALLEAAPGIKIMVTSRARLSLNGEYLYPVKGLRLPSPLQAEQDPRALEEFSAVRLFLQSARRIQPAFSLDIRNASTVARICQAVQGMPLGLELAASWLEILEPDDILNEIQSSLDFLETTQLDVPERQRSLRAVFDTSWKMLTPAERQLFMKLSIFRGSFTRQAAQQIAGATLIVLSGLVSKSFLHNLTEGRYEVHELLRQFGADELHKDQRVWTVSRDRHSAYYLNELADEQEGLYGPQHMQVLERLDADLVNLRSALNWALESEQIELIDRSLYPLYVFLNMRGLASELQINLEKAATILERSPGSVQRRILLVKILTLISAVMYDIVSETRPQLLQRALDMLDEPGMARQMGVLFSLLAYEYGTRIDPLEGIRMLRQSLDWLRQAGDRIGESLTLKYLGDLLVVTGQFEQAQQSLEQAIAICKSRGDRIGLAGNNLILAGIHFHHEDIETGERLLLECQEIFTQTGDQYSLYFFKMALGEAMEGRGEYEKSIVYIQEAKRIIKELGWPDGVAVALSWESIVNLRLGNVDQARQLRQESFDLANAINDRSDIIWGLLEMGEIERVAGDLSKAESLLQQCAALHQDTPMSKVQAFYFKGMGDLALDKGDPQAALRYFEQSQALARRDYNYWCIFYSGFGMARAALASGDLAAARKHIACGINTPEVGVSPPLFTYGLGVWAEWCAANQDYPRAVELGSLVSQHPATWQDVRDRADQLILRCATRLPAREFSSAQARARKLDLLATIKELSQASE